MATRPTDYLNWTDGANTKVSKPPTALANSGWTPGQSPTAQHMNYALYILDQWSQYLDQRSSGGGTGGSAVNNARMLGGGTWSLSGTTLSWSAAFQVAIPGQADTANQVAAGGVTIPDGSVAYLTLNVPIQYSGSTTSGSTSLTNLTSINGLAAGMGVSGPGIASGTTITSVSGTTVVLSANATATNGSAIYTFQSSGALTATVAAEASVSAGTATCIFARNVGGTILLGVGAVDMLMRDGESRALRGTGFQQTITAVAGQSMTQGTVVYIADSTDTTPTARTAGYCYPNDTTSNGTGIRSTVAGVLAQNVSNGGTATIVTNGIVTIPGLTGATALNPGTLVWANVYLAGGVQQWTPPFIASSYKTLVGLAVSSNQVLVRGGGADQSMTLNPTFGNVGAVNVTASGTVTAGALSSPAGYRFLVGGGNYVSSQAQGWTTSGVFNTYGPGGLQWVYLAQQAGIFEGLRIVHNAVSGNVVPVFKLYGQSSISPIGSNASLLATTVGPQAPQGGSSYAVWIPLTNGGTPIATQKGYAYFIQISSNQTVANGTQYNLTFAAQVVD